MARTDKRLSAALRAAQRGDQDAFRRLYRAVQPRLVRYLSVLVGEAADQVAAQTWQEITQGLGDFRGDFQRFRGWITVIGRGRALENLRGRDPGAPTSRQQPAPAGDSGDADRATEPPSTDAAIALIAGLPADQGEAVLLRVVMGLNTRQAAEILGRTAEAIETTTHQGLRNLADRLERAGAPPRAGDEPGAEVNRP
ncbi:RNA polymerase sigma factor [Actinomadura sp. KC216]|uniref:RNA polymerase sigma factor n=1 Tax=Actinomadura sp. KC216 TaxID=2530370 RepID=UPI001042C271|nr:RNA polymerase sigma factor [Actinomadura sp. KC216]TDB87217.1 RNA polymerase sigma factor [Actinomadura sp. KC216]